MDLAELTRVDRSIAIEAPPERVFRALTDAAEISAWFRVTVEGRLEPGQTVWMTSVLPSHAGQRYRVDVVEVTAPRRVVWRWHPGEVDPSLDYSREPMTTVIFTLEPSEGGTTLRVAETGFDQISLARRAKVHADNSQGWTEVIVWLQQYVEAH